MLKFEAIIHRNIQVASVKYSPDEKFIASVNKDGDIRILDAITLVQLSILLVRDVTPVECSPDSQFILSSHFDNTINILRSNTLE